MPDVLTHLATGHWAGRLLAGRQPARQRRLALLLAALTGAALPDLLTRVPSLLLSERVDGIGSFVAPLHCPLPYLLACALLSRTFVEELRAPVFAGLAIGGLIHLAADLGQRNLRSLYMVFFPFTASGYQLGLYEPEASVRWAPAFLAASAALEIVLYVSRRVVRCQNRKKPIPEPPLASR
ncbi:MAG: metal-dependent hydrolase [Planctomycetes bacterium]|nr:metal-dependent hydrolase [Planctomycetota bacterium]